MLHERGALLWIGLAIALGAAPVAAQTAPTNDAAPASSTTAEPATPAAPTAPTTASATNHDADQDAEIARLRAELEAYKAKADSAAAKEAAQDAALASASSSETTDTTDELLSQPVLRIYGFMDMGVQGLWGGLYDLGVVQSKAPTFVLGNVNLYFDAKPNERWRALTEVRLTTFPNGAETLDPGKVTITRYDTTVQDYTSPNAGFTSLQWGGIILERAHIDYTATDALNVRAGYFLTPYGIWNVDHGSPTRIMLREPLFMSIQLLPQRQVGVDVFGVFHALPWELGYHVYVSNGRAATVDFSADKAVGVRLVASTRRPTPVQLGTSLYYGNETIVENGIGLTGGMVGVTRTTTVDYNELAGGGDVSVDLGGLRLRSELVARRVVYEPGKRPLFAGVPEANSTKWGGYFMAAYTLPWYGLEPLLSAELVRYPSIVAEGFIFASAGLNVHFSDSTTLRTQYIYSHGVELFESGYDLHRAYYHVLASRLVMAF